MGELLKNPEFWKALVGLAWPLVALIAFFTLKGKIFHLFNRENLTIKVAGIELSVVDAARNTGEQVAEMQKRFALMEETLKSLSDKSANSKLGATTDRLVKTSRHSVKNDPQKSNIGSASNFSILWVDDFPSNNAFIVEDFYNRGFLVRTILSTQAALVELQHSRFDIVISDFGRIENGIDNPFAGLELVRAIRAKDKLTPILIFAGARGIEYKLNLLKEGATEVTDSAIDLQSFVFKSVRQKVNESKQV